MQVPSNRVGVVAQHNRLLVALGILAVWIVITLGGGRLAIGGQGSLDDLVTRQVGLQFVLAALVVLAAVVALGWRRAVGLKAATPPRSWRVVWLPALFIGVFVLVAVLYGLPPAQTVVFVLINTLLVGVSEELMFRGTLFYGLLARVRVWPAVVLTAMLFGLVHALNGFITGDFAAAAAQAAAAALSGFWLHAIRVRTHSLYPAIIIHGLWDFAVFVFGLAASGGTPSRATPAAANLLGPILFEMPLFVYGLWLLRGVGKQDPADVLA